MNFINELKFNESGLISTIAQDYITGQILMFAYMNKEALKLTVETGKVHYFSRSRNKLWLKGETSGNVQHLKGLAYDCDGDALLLKIEQSGPACHTGSMSCFFNSPLKEYEIDELHNNNNIGSILEELYKTVSDRKNNPKEGSYTNYLFDKGIDKILKKVGEESTEVVIAAKNQSKEEMCGEVADLFYHLTVLLVEKGIAFDKVYNKLAERQQK